MDFIPNTTLKKRMLNEIQVENINELFADIPKKILINQLNLPKGLSQQHVEEKLKKIAQHNRSATQLTSFLGGGIKPHYIPAAVKAIVSRSEFYTAYTPYQPEASQGFLQSMFEYQSMIAEITGMDIANASLYDGSTALGEAALMCARISKKKTFLIPQNISWEKKSILRNYTKGAHLEIKEIPYEHKTGTMNLDILEQSLDANTAGVYIENPNFFGVFEDQVDKIHSQVHEHNSLFIVGIDPFSLGVVKNPGDYGADIVIGEGRGLGSPMDFGGSGLGIFACKQDFVRQIPGRIIGIAKDSQGKRAFCMTLQTREQHIRRGKATSNICTNEGLCALTAAVYLSGLGSSGLAKLGTINLEKGQQLAKALAAINRFTQRFTAAHFNEFVVSYDGDITKLQQYLLQNNILGGLPLGQWYPELNNCLLFGVTELHTDEQINTLLTLLKEVP